MAANNMVILVGWCNDEPEEVKNKSGIPIFKMAKLEVCGFGRGSATTFYVPFRITPTTRLPRYSFRGKMIMVMGEAFSYRSASGYDNIYINASQVRVFSAGGNAKAEEDKAFSDGFEEQRTYEESPNEQENIDISDEELPF